MNMWSEGGVLRLLSGLDKGGGARGGGHMGTLPRACSEGEGIERHWGRVNPHSLRPSLSMVGHNKPRLPPPESPW